MDTWSPDPALQPARLAAGYRVVGRLRRRPDSVLYRAIREDDEREVVLKVLHTESYPIDEEAARLRRLPDHPHLVRVLGHGRTGDGLPFLAMAFHSGGSYEEWLARFGPVTVDEAVSAGVAVAGALAAVHGTGLLHGDVTPGNVLRGEDGPLLTDFAVAPAAEEVAGTVALDRLTPQHAAPELLLRQPVEARSDVYGLASTVWTLLAGHPPFAAPGPGTIDPFEYREHALHTPVPPVPRGDVPWWLQAVLRRAMAKSAGDRYPDAAAFAAALHARADPMPAPSASEPPPAPVIVVPAPVDGTAVHGSVLPHPRPPTQPVPEPSPPIALEPAPPADDEPTVDQSPLPPAPRPPAVVRRPRARSWVDVQPTGEVGAARLPSAPPAAPQDGAAWEGASDFQPEWQPVERRPRRRRLLVAGSVAFTVMLGVVLATAVASQFALEPDAPPPPPAGTAPPETPDAALGPADPVAPTDLEIADERVAVALSWQDPTDGQASFTVVGGPVDGPRDVWQPAPGQTSIRINGLNPQVDYCFQVLAATSIEGDEIPASEEECTDRFE
jgi:eukaryotic-like serine/threonine-protein kinase